MKNAPDKEVTDRPDEPFSADPVEARAQLEAMRPSLLRYFQYKNVPPSHDEELVEKTMDIVWDKYYSGAEIRHRRAYTRKVALSVLSRYFHEGRHRDVQAGEYEGSAAGSGEFDVIDEELDQQKWLACVESCRRKLVDGKKFSKECVNAAIEYMTIEGKDKERRDALATRCGMSRQNFEQFVRKVRAKLIHCIGICMRRPREK